MRAEWVEKRIFYRKIYNLCSNLKGGKICPKKRYYCPSNMQTSVLSSQIKVKVCYTFQAQRVINWGIKNLKSDCFNPIKTGGSSEIPKLHKALTYWVKRLSTIKKFQKSNIILEGSRHPNFMNPFEYGKTLHNKSFTKRIGTLTPPNP